MLKSGVVARQFFSADREKKGRKKTNGHFCVVILEIKKGRPFSAKYVYHDLEETRLSAYSPVGNGEQYKKFNLVMDCEEVYFYFCCWICGGALTLRLLVATRLSWIQGLVGFGTMSA